MVVLFYRFTHLLIGTLDLIHSDHYFLDYLFDHPRLLSLAGQPDLERLSVVPNFFNLRMVDANVFLGTFDAAEMFLYPSPYLCFDTILSLSPHGLLFTLTYIINCQTLYRQVRLS